MFKTLAAAVVCAKTFSVVCACTAERKPPELRIEVEPKDGSPQPLTANEVLDTIRALEAVAPRNSQIGQAVQDVYDILDARAAEQNGDKAAAMKKWQRAVTSSEGPIALTALKGWLRVYAANNGQKMDPVVLAKLVLAELQHGGSSEYLRSKRIVSPNALLPLLKDTVPEWLTTVPDSDGNVAMQLWISPSAASGDPLFQKRAKSYCDRNVDAATVNGWKSRITSTQATYFEGLVAKCQEEHELAADLLGRAATGFSQSGGKEAAQFAVHAAQAAVQAARAGGNRELAATLYLKLIAMWEQAPAGFMLVDMTREQTALERINDMLWASRYRALVADYETSQNLAQRALDAVTKTFAELPRLEPRQKTQLGDLRVEAYHALAFRVAIEKTNLDAAISLTQIALQTPDVSKEWSNRLRWFLGLYRYMAKDYLGAKREWEGILSATTEESLRARLFYWLARTYARLGKTGEAQFYQKTLLEDYPLDYYSVAAKSDIPGKASDWSAEFGAPSDLAEVFTKTEKFTFDDVRGDKVLRRLLTRAEVLVEAEIAEFAPEAVRELRQVSAKTYRLSDQPVYFTYITRLQYASSLLRQAISLTHELSVSVPKYWRRWPEQLFVAFPRPYSDAFVRNSLSSGVDVDLLYAVAHQESHFVSDAVSPADAIGLLQVLPSTARKIANEQRISTDNLRTRLTEPEFNLTISSLYLKKLQTQFGRQTSSVVAAYNAGEFSVNAWLARRAQPDESLWIELIPYEETREYVKRVLRNYAVYRQLKVTPKATPRRTASRAVMDGSGAATR